MKNSSAKVLYWLLALRIATKDEIITWSDKQIESGSNELELYSLSTCSEYDENEIMNLLKKLSAGSNAKEVGSGTLARIADWYESRPDSEPMKTNLLFDIGKMDDISESTKNKIIWLEDEVCFMRDGIQPKVDSMKSFVASKLREMSAA